MGLFSRRRAALPDVEPVSVAIAPIRSVPTPSEPQGLVRGWSGDGLGVLSRAQQIGSFSGGPVTMRAGMVNERQRLQGVESLSSSWYVPPQMTAASAWQITQHGAAAPGVQKFAGGSTGQLGPITARRMRANVTAQQIRQSGLSAVQWAQQLSPQ